MVVCITYQDELSFFSFANTVYGRNPNRVHPLVEVSWKPDEVICHHLHFESTAASKVVVYAVGQCGRCGRGFWRLSQENAGYIC